MTTAKEAVDVIDAAAAAIEHSRWGNRLWYLAICSGATMVVLGGAIWFDKPVAVINGLYWLMVWLSFLMVVTPSAEQSVKMLAQVKSIRAGGSVQNG